MLDLITSIKATLYERVYSPLSGTLIISSLVSNYQLTLLIFSSLSYEEKIEILNDKLSDCYYIGIHIFFYPIAFTIFYFTVYPIIENIVYKTHLEKNKKLADLKNKIEESRLLTEKESKSILERVRVAEYKHNNEIKSKEDEIQFLKKKITSLESEIKKSAKEKEEKDNSLESKIKEAFIDENKRKILNLIYKDRKKNHYSTNGMSESSIIEKMKPNEHYHTRVILKELNDKNIILTYIESETLYYLSHEGMLIIDQIERMNND